MMAEYRREQTSTPRVEEGMTTERDPDIEEAVERALQLMRRGVPPPLANYKAADYCGVSVSAVAQRTGEIAARKKAKEEMRERREAIEPSWTPSEGIGTPPARVVAFDTETHLIQPGLTFPPLVCVQHCQIAPERTPPVVLHARDGGGDLVGEWLRDEETTLIGQSVAFDLGVDVQAASDREKRLREVFHALDHGRVRCIKVRGKLLSLATGDRQTKFDLGTLAKVYGAAPVDKSDPWRLRYAELANVPVSEWPKDAIHYAKEDARATADVCLAQGEKAHTLRYLDPAHPDAVVDEVAQVRADFALHLVAGWGFRTDQARVVALRNRLEMARGEAGQVLTAAGVLRRAGTVGMGKLRAHVVADCQARGVAPEKTPGGDVATDADTLADAKDPVLVAFQAYKHADKIAGTYLPHLVAGVTGPVCCRYDSLVDTGRTSAYGPNVQNWPRERGVRECITPRPGFVFSSCDYSVLELRTLAQVCVDLGFKSSLAQLFRDGVDPHLRLGALLGGFSYDNAKEWLHGTDPVARKRAKHFRQLAKAANFGFPGGLGAAGFLAYAKGYGLTLSLGEAEQIKASWFQAYPEMRDYFRYVSAGAGPDDTQVVTQLRSLRRRAGCSYTAACNTPFQGLAADGAKAALYEVVRECFLDRTSDLYGSRPIAFVHDEIVCEHPVEHAHEAATRLATVMAEVMQKWTPDVPQAVEPCLMDCWSKEAETLQDADGRLVVWHAPPPEVCEPYTPPPQAEEQLPLL